MSDLWEHLQEMDKLRVELDMYQRMDIEAVEWAVRHIKELETRLTTIEKAVEMSDNTSSPESYILVDNDEISLAIYGPLLQFAEEQDNPQ